MSVKRVCYFYDGDVGNYYYGCGHPMKPHRIRMAHNLILNYGLYQQLYVYRPPRASALEMTKFHTDDYVDFLQTVAPDNRESYSKQLLRFNVGEDCPVFDGMFEFCQLSTGGSIGGAVRLNRGDADYAINWAGGLHHAKKSEASGFCYINDIVLAILELLKYHSRVMYIDIDIHHGDGVEEAFYNTNRVLTVSFHKFGEFFPGTGDPRDVGVGEGRNHAINFPLKDGINDLSYEMVFCPLISAIVERYRPGAIVLQCGADSLAGDRLGCFNLSVKGHAKCVEFVKKFNIPTLVLGGGGYTIRNVARAWTYETSILLGVEIDDKLPYNDYLEYYGPDYRLHTEPSNMENLNSPDYLNSHLNDLLKIVKQVEIAPSVAPFARPPDAYVGDEKAETDAEDPDVRKLDDDVSNRLFHKDDMYDNTDKLHNPQRDHQNYDESQNTEGGETERGEDDTGGDEVGGGEVGDGEVGGGEVETSEGGEGMKGVTPIQVLNGNSSQATSTGAEDNSGGDGASPSGDVAPVSGSIPVPISQPVVVPTTASEGDDDKMELDM